MRWQITNGCDPPIHINVAPSWHRSKKHRLTIKYSPRNNSKAQGSCVPGGAIAKCHHDRTDPVLKRQGKADKTIDSCARAVRRVACVFGRYADDLAVEELQQYFANLIHLRS